MSRSILFVFTSADKCLDGKPIGWYLPEAAHPYYALKDTFTIVGASPKGGKAPIDNYSVETFTDDESKNFLKDPEAIKVWSETKKLSEVDAKDYEAIFVVGGHGPLFDLAVDEDFKKIAEDTYAAKKPVSAVCHGPAAFNLAKDPKTSKSIISGAELTAFSNSEEAQTPYNDFVNTLPFSLEDRMKELGANFVKGEDWGSKVVWDKGILTGQNPASAGALGKKLKEILG